MKSFSLEIKQGERVALVGQSGSGKTTLVNLIARFLEPSEGRILIDGQDISKVSHRSLRRQMAFVTQDVVLFDSTLKDNLTYGLGNVTECDIQKALEVASLTELVQALPEGLETRVGEGGNMLSGGQKQRVSIARAFLKNAPILIMDEATSALDSKTEQQVVKAMNRLREGRTCITVAHRLGSVMEANRVFVMSAGKVIEEGSPQKLIQMKGFFYRAAKDQLLAGRGKP